MSDEEVTFLRHTSCPSCGSSDANGIYSDGHTYCHKCGKWAPGDGAPQRRQQRVDFDFLQGEARALTARCLDEETCRKYGYRIARDERDQAVQVADYRNVEGGLVAQKVRYADKTFKVRGKGGNTMPLFGQNLWAAGGKRLVITEGEIDAMSVAQVFGLSWPVVSVPNGADGALKSIKAHLEYVESFGEVVFAFDMDEPGRAAATECAQLLAPGKAKIAEMPLKDSNEMLKAGETRAIMTAVYQAREYRPDGIVSLRDIAGRTRADLEIGRPWAWPELTKATFGRRLGEVYGFGAGTGVGKTDLFTQSIAYDVEELRVKCGVLFLEQGVAETGRRIAGKIAGKRFHIPGGHWTAEELDAALSKLETDNLVHLYDSFGVVDWDTIKSRIRYLVCGLGCEHVYLDHMTALAAAEDDERKALERIMAEAAGMAKGLNFILHYVSHLTTPETGKPHEEGGRVTIRQFKGSRALGYWSHSMFGLERDQQASSQEERRTTRLRCLKERYTGNATGMVFNMRYDNETGLLSEQGLLEDVEASDDF